MSTIFPSQEWLGALMEKLNTDEKYAQTARNWEGDLMFVLQPSGALGEETYLFISLWHGECKDIAVLGSEDEREVAFKLIAKYDNFLDVLLGKLDPMQAMITRKLQVKGSMPYMMRNVPTVLEFVRCAREVTDNYLGK